MNRDNRAVHTHDRGLSLDVPKLLGRRQALTFLGATGVVVLTGCGSDDDTSTTATTQARSAAQGSGSSSSTSEGEIPEETAGPYPADGSNGPDVLGESGVVRSDITSSFGSSSTTTQPSNSPRSPAATWPASLPPSTSPSEPSRPHRRVSEATRLTAVSGSVSSATALG